MPEKSTREMVSSCLRQLRDGDANTRAKTVSALRKLGFPNLLPVLMDRLKEADAEEKCLLAETLYRVSAQASVEPLLSLLADPDWIVRVQVCGLLHDAGDSIACVPLTRAMTQDPHAMVRNTAAYALGGIADISTIPALVEVAMSDHEPDELGHTASDCAVTALENILDAHGVIRREQFRTTNSGHRYVYLITEAAKQAYKDIE